jgi:hypothetical protein
MLKIKRKNRPKRADWFPDKTYLHFDGPVTRAKAEALVKDPDSVVRHSFLPLISFDKRDRKFRRPKIGPGKAKQPKIRKIAYCSNMDACVFSYYAYLLHNKYEDLIDRVGIEKSVIGYRKIGSNIELAFSAFEEIRSKGSCVAFAFDISGFFDNIDHAILKRNWCRVLGVDRLPEDHYKVFSRLTKFSTVNRQACLRRLGHKPSARDGDIPNWPLCSMETFRQVIRGDDGVSTNLVVPWKKDYGIPQGTPLSALAANISMIDFDSLMTQNINALGGSYRRYSDDILIIVPSQHRAEIEQMVPYLIKIYTRRLKFNAKKN